MTDIPYLVENEAYEVPSPRPALLASGGGQGSFSYLDTKVYGPRQQRQAYMGFNVWHFIDGTVSRKDDTAVSRGLIIPGTGGSAKAPGRRYFGSRATGYNPNGLVLIRLIKI